MSENRRCEDQMSFGSWVKWVFGTFFFRLLGANILFLLSCIPVVTIPSAICGLHAVVQRYYRKQYAAAGISGFFTEYLTTIVKRTFLIWALLLIPLAAAALTSGLLPSPVWFSLTGFMLIWTILILSWLFPQLVLLNLSITQALKNAVLLTCLEAKRNFLLIVIHIASMTILIYGLPVTAFLLLFLPVLNTVLTTGITMPVLQQYLVLPENEQEHTRRDTAI